MLQSVNFHRFWSHWCGRSMAALLLLTSVLLFNIQAVQAAGEPTLSIPTITQNVMNNSTFTVPLTLANAESNDISALSFSLDFDSTCLTFDSVTDINTDNVPDSVTDLPSGYVTTVSYDGNHTIDFTLNDQEQPQTVLSNGALANFEFGVQSSCRTTDGTQPQVLFDFASPTYGNDVGAAVTGFATDGTYTLRFNAYPTDIAMSATAVDENVALATTVGSFTSSDLDKAPDPLGDTHTYSLVSGTGSDNNGSFVIEGAALKTNSVLNYELKSSYSVRVRTTDSYGGSYEEAFTITINDLNEAPTSLTINQSSVNENAATNTVVGNFSSIDPDAGATATYSLIAGVGSTNNAAFNISGTALRTSEIFNYENKNSYNIRVQVTDNGTPGLTLETIFTIRVKNVNDTPVAVADEISPTLQVISEATDLFVLTNDTDQDINDVLTVASVTTPTTGSGTVGNLGSAVRYTPTADFNGPVIFPYAITDGQATSTDANVTLQVVANDARGDCNSDSELNAGDFPAFVLEINDGDDAVPWYNIYLNGFAGSPLGCDANANKSVTIADLSCAVLVSFGNTTCTTSPALAANDPVNAKLAIDQNLVGVLDSTVNVPIRLTTNEQHVAAANFALSFDNEQLTFDPTDADQDGLPDAVNFNTPAGMVTTAHYNTAANRLELTIYAVTMPMPTLSDGMVAEVTLKVNPEASSTETPLTLLQSSLGSDQGQSVPVQVSDSSVQITKNHPIFLPLLNR